MQGGWRGLLSELNAGVSWGHIGVSKEKKGLESAIIQGPVLVVRAIIGLQYVHILWFGNLPV